MRLDDLGVLRCVPPERLDAANLADAVMAAATTTPAAPRSISPGATSRRGSSAALCADRHLRVAV